MATETTITVTPTTTKTKEFNMLSSESKQKLHEKIQQPPGSWFARNIRSLWYLTYAFFVMFFKILREMFTRNRRYDPRSEPRRPGEVVVITGGPSGIAYELAKKFLQLDFVVIMGCRNVSASQGNVDKMRQQGVINGTIHLLPLRLNSLTSTKEFADGVLKLTSRIDFLINNAGIMMTPYESTEDGYEGQFQVNYLSHFLLTMLLLPTIKQTSQDRDCSCRIINTSSDLHLVGSLDFDDLETREIYVPSKAYYDSKLCQVVFAKQLEKRLQQQKVNVHSYAVHPGVIPSSGLWSAAGYSAMSFLLKPLLPTTEDGADAIMYTALSSKLEKCGGAYLEGLRIGQPNSQANNVWFQELLWSRSEFFCQAWI